MVFDFTIFILGWLEKELSLDSLKLKVSRRRGSSKAILLSINDDKLNMVPPKSMIINQPVKSGESSVGRRKSSPPGGGLRRGPHSCDQEAVNTARFLLQTAARSRVEIAVDAGVCDMETGHGWNLPPLRTSKSVETFYAASGLDKIR